jgi:LmbE family N-acetylglucosaminyl deacetylase
MLLKKVSLLIISFLAALMPLTQLNAQQAKSWNSAQILHEIQKLKVCGSVLYVAAHPDDENTRLLAYLANERKVRTGYLSLTRGDGGQNLIGNEQGIELGLIRTQELLAARRIDGAEQFFSSAFDFGFSKTSEETFAIWGKDKILADVVWVIRKFKPDVIITRFPEDARAGHGHHAASGILAREAFYAAADKTKFPEQFQYGVLPWQAKRVVWNTFNFGGGTNTINENQLKMDVGQYNPLLGKSYGELAAESRSQHKSQGFGVPSQRGSQIEYFSPVGGDSTNVDILEGVNTKWNRYGNTDIDSIINRIVASFQYQNPEKSLEDLLVLNQKINMLPFTVDRDAKLVQLKNIIAQVSGLYMEATTTMPYAIQGDSLRINIAINSRLVDDITLKNIFYKDRKFDNTSILAKNKNVNIVKNILIGKGEKLTEPYWLKEVMNKGSFNIKTQTQVGKPDVDYEMVQFVYEIGDQLFIYDRPLQYKYTDPVKAEIFQPVYIVPAVDVTVTPTVVVNTPKQTNTFIITVEPKMNFAKNEFDIVGNNNKCDTIYRYNLLKDSLSKNNRKQFSVNSFSFAKQACGGSLEYGVTNKGLNLNATQHLRAIHYDHIPTLAYFQKAKVNFINANIITSKKKIGYIMGAGDKVPEAITQLGYTIEYITEKDCNDINLEKYDAIITGIRAYNTNEWMNDAYDALMRYVNKGGNLIVQYNTSNQIGPVKAKIAPYNFTISRNRITDENAGVTILNNDEALLNKPNKIIATDFDNWVQERSVYEATDVDAKYRKLFTMNDKNEKSSDGSIIVGAYGKGNFIYCGLALFRQLPAGVTGAYKLLANMIELSKNK